jgi:hypothetical protein
VRSDSTLLHRESLVPNSEEKGLIPHAWDQDGALERYLGIGTGVR